MNLFTDKYFTKAKEVAIANDMNPTVKYRVFGRFDGLAALEPVRLMLQMLAPNALVQILPTGTPFIPGDTIMIIEGKFQEIVELETMYLQWCGLPCYCANQAKFILDSAKEKDVMDFSARHLFGAESGALASYGASVGGIKKFSTDSGANAYAFLSYAVDMYKNMLEHSSWISRNWNNKGIGTIPHALIALFKGDYIKCAEAYAKAFPNEKQIHLIDYNNKEVDDTLFLLERLGEKLQAVRIDTCGENRFQGMDMLNGVCQQAVEMLRKELDKNDGQHVEIIVSSGFDWSKTLDFMTGIPNCFDRIGTGSFIPKLPQCTSDIFEVDGRNECKVGRDWGYNSNRDFYDKVYK